MVELRKVGRKSNIAFVVTNCRHIPRQLSVKKFVNFLGASKIQKKGSAAPAERVLTSLGLFQLQKALHSLSQSRSGHLDTGLMSALEVLAGRES